MSVDGGGEARVEPIGLSLVREQRTAATRPLVMPVVMAPDAAPLVAALYRTEDVAVAPDGRRVVIPAFFSDVVVLADLDVVRRGESAEVHVSGVGTVQCDRLRFPHGACFLDDRTVLVANRGAELLALDVPARGVGPTAVFRSGRVLVAEDDPVPVRAPSSLAARTAGALVEVFVCNNGSHTVTRYVIDRHDDLAVVDREVLIGDGLATPDGIAISRSGRWLAISNHDTHEVFVVAYDPSAATPARHVGTLRGPNYPHGVRFVDDDGAILVNDAGLPYLYVFTAPDGDWSGVRDPVRTLRVMDDATFNSGRYNPQEGGPKGLAVLDAQRAIVMTSTYQHVACIELDDVLDGPAAAGRSASVGSGPSGPSDDAVATTTDLVRRTMRRVDDATAELAAARRRVDALEQAADEERRQVATAAERAQAAEVALTAARSEVAAVRAELDALTERLAVVVDELASAHHERARAIAELTAIRRSTSWRVTRPVRAVLDRLRRSVS